MTHWIFKKGDEASLMPAFRGSGQITTVAGEGRNSSEKARDHRPSCDDTSLDVMEKGGDHRLSSEAPRSAERGVDNGVPRALLSTAPEPSSPRDHSPESHPLRSSSGTVRGALSRIGHVAADAMERYMLGSDSDDDSKHTKIPAKERYAGQREKADAFLANAEAQLAEHRRTMSPFERYRMRMGETLNSTGGRTDEDVDPKRPINRIASSNPNRSVDPPTQRRLLVSDQPLHVAPPESRASLDSMGTRAASGPSPHNGGVRGSLEMQPGKDVRTTLRRSPPVTDDAARSPSMPAIDEERSITANTRVTNLRIVKPRYLIPREIAYAFGAATTLGLAIGCVTLAIGIRNANYLRGPHASSLLPSVQSELDQVMHVVNAIAAKLGVDVGLR